MVYTNAPETLRGWYKQRKRWWYGNLQLWRLHKKMGNKEPMDDIQLLRIYYWGLFYHPDHVNTVLNTSI
ncbi:hypothetical protein [Methanosarcina horonobensis]|uniref:hypothetical protein n=1 Tax=Methanosarcina horonobensis TaxID=418008 RepID=UPI00373FE15A